MKNLQKKLSNAIRCSSPTKYYYLFITVSVTLWIAIHSEPLHAQSAEWKGAIQIPGTPLGIELYFLSSDSALISIPMQGAHDLPLQKVHRNSDSLYFELPAGIGLATFEGVFITADSVSGQFYQRGQQFPFYLKTGNVPIATNVDQLASLGNIKEKEIEIALSDGIISGTLTYPNQPGKFPLIILISGSGLQTRDEEVAGFKVFKEISDGLSRSEYAVFRYDDRGIGKSTVPDPTQSTIQDLADEVIGILDHMRKETVVLPDQTVLLGHSLGGLVALEVAKQISRLKGLILMATPAYPGKVTLLQQIQKNLQLAGKTQAEIDTNLSLQRSIYQALDDSNKLPEVREVYKQHMMKELKRLPAAQKKQLGDLNQYAEHQVVRQLAQMRTQAMKSFLNYDPLVKLSEVDQPVLILQGEKDVQVVAEPNLKRFRIKLDSAGIDYRIATFPIANHLFQKANTGLIQEYGTLEKRFVEEFLPVITEWLGEKF